MEERVSRSHLSRLRMLSPTKRISRTFHSARHAPWHHRGPLMPSPIKAKCSAKKKCNKKEAWGGRKDGRRRSSQSRAGRERSSASVAGKNSGRCYSWCELSRSGFIMQQHKRHSLLSLWLCASVSPPGADVPDLSGDGGKNLKLKIQQIYVNVILKLMQIK